MEKQAYMVLSIVLGVGLVASVVVLGVLPALSPGPTVQQLDIHAVDFSFSTPGSQPTYTVKAGEIIYVKFTNDGNNPHEIMLVEDKDAVLSAMQGVIDNILADTETYPDEESQEAAFEEAHEMMGMAFRDIEADVGIDEVAYLSFILPAGTYYFVCHEPDGTWPQLHQHAGMWATLVVEA